MSYTMYTASTLHLLTCVFIETTAQWAVSPKWTPANVALAEVFIGSGLLDE